MSILVHTFTYAMFFVGLFLVFVPAHLFVVFYEEPRLKRSFGREYTAYCKTVGRWLPKL